MAEKSRVAIRSTTDATVEDAVREVLERCGWEQVVPRDALVVVKPNLCTPVPEKLEMSNTDIRITEAVCRILLERTKRVYIGESDHLRARATEAFAVTGYDRLAEKLGVKLVNFSDAPQRSVAYPPVGTVDLPELLLDADVFVTLPVLKTHALTYFTGTLKNQWGCVPRYNRILLHRYIHEMLAWLHGVFKPRLCVMDGIVGMEGRGPVNGKPRRLNIVLGSRDGVALDATAMRLVGLEPTRARHIAIAGRDGLGNLAESEIEVDGDWPRFACHFEPAAMDPAVAAMNYMTRYGWFVRYALEKDSVFYPVRGLVQILRRLGIMRQYRDTRGAAGY